MRRLMLAFLLLVALPAAAQNPPAAEAPAAKNPPPAGLQPLPDVPPPPPGASDALIEPQVTIVQHGDTKEEQYRVNGKLYMIKVIPPHGGKPYYLIDERGDGTWSRQESMDSGIRVPMWVIHTF